MVAVISRTVYRNEGMGKDGGGNLFLRRKSISIYEE